MTSDDETDTGATARLRAALQKLREWTSRARDLARSNPQTTRGVAATGVAIAIVVLAWWIWPTGSHELAACPNDGGHLGYATPDGSFDGKPGTLWTVEAPTTVRSRRQGGSNVCSLAAGTRVVLLNDTTGGDPPFVSVFGEAILDDDEAPLATAASAPGEAPAPAPAPAPDTVPARSVEGAQGGLCPGPADVIVGYTRVSPLFTVPTGRSWAVTRERDVRSGHPARGNDYRQDFDVICRLPRGAQVMVRSRPVRTGGHGTWLPIYAGSATL